MKDRIYGPGSSFFNDDFMFPVSRIIDECTRKALTPPVPAIAPDWPVGRLHLIESSFTKKGTDLYELRILAAGVDPNQIKAELSENGYVVISHEALDGKTSTVKVRLDGNKDPESVKMRAENGILTISCKDLEKQTPRKIPIKIEGI